MRLAPSGIAEPAPCQPLFRLQFFPKTLPGPRSGRAGATAAEHPCPAGQAGLTALRRATGRDREWRG
uniref:hypothetical protein n=1 Tax=Rhizobium rhizogenes TaxID=359 RepID=UPI00155DC995|nr:hypothetical protein [Rhizobium rhizogenes]